MNPRVRTDLLLLAAFCGFLFFYGLGAFGLVGADEPRYAQVAREMLDRFDWVTPTLRGKPWLEKPVLYYWEAMLSYRLGRALLPAKEQNGGAGAPARPNGPSAVNDGVSDQTARFPGAIDAAFMIAAIYFFLRRLRPGSELEGALIAGSCAGVIGFAHAASTDMPLTATFAIALLAWYDWYERRSRTALAVFYLFLALGTLAKGPVALALAAVILILFAAVRREWSVILRTLWVPGVALFLIVALPWYIAVQMRNPEFLRVFILEHNLGRFSTNVYHHPQPFWFYLPVFLLATMPWTLWLIVAVTERARQVWRDGREAFASPEDSWALFLLIWMLVPILFFSASQSKLPGYILPAVPAAALLITEYLAAHREEKDRILWPLAATHGVLCGVLVCGALLAASIALNHHLTLAKGTYIAAAIGGVVAVAIAGALVTRAGPRLVRAATMSAVIVGVAAVIRFAAPAIDATQTARPIAEIIQALSHEPAPIALYRVNRIQEYGLDFYMNRATQRYESGDVPAEAHVLVAAPNTEAEFRALLGGRKVSYLTSVPEQKVGVYWVGK